MKWKIGDINEFKQIVLKSSKVLFIGMGNNIKSEDGIGLFLIDLLEKKLAGEKYSYLVTYNVPINFLSKIISVNPDLIVFVDAMILDEADNGDVIFAGTDYILPTNSLTTHYQDFDLLKEFIDKGLEKNVEYFFLGITISNTDYGLFLPENLKKVAIELTEEIIESFN